MLGLDGIINCFIYLNSDDLKSMKSLLKECLGLNIFKRNKLGIYKDIEFNFLQQNSTRKLLLSNYVDLTNGKLK